MQPKTEDGLERAVNSEEYVHTTQVLTATCYASTSYDHLVSWTPGDVSGR